MAGGRGTRFWPLSRYTKPKQLLSLTDSRSFLSKTVDRILPLVGKERVIVVAASSHAEGVYKALPNISRENILIEPEGKNTAPAIAFAAAHLLEREREAVMAVMPADHEINPPEKFLQDLEMAADFADETRALVTFGIRPTRPETGFGYIKVGGKIDRNIFNVTAFKEKPNRKKAKDYVDSGHYLWNSGLFVFRCDVFMEKIKTCLPGLFAATEIYAGSPKQKEDLQKFYGSIEPVSFDYGVMEKTDQTAVIRASFNWSDVGSWDAIDELWEADENENRKNHCTLVTVNSKANTVISRKLVALLGVENLIIVETDDALLIGKKDRAQEIKSIVKEIERRGLKEYL